MDLFSKEKSGTGEDVDDDIIFTSSKECDPPSDQCKAETLRGDDEDVLINVKVTPTPSTTPLAITHEYPLPELVSNSPFMCLDEIHLYLITIINYKYI